MTKPRLDEVLSIAVPRMRHIKPEGGPFADPMTWRLTTFGPAQAAEITGVSVELQRDWRRRKVLPPTPNGWTRFTSLELAQLMVRKEIGAVGGVRTDYDLLIDMAGLAVLDFAVESPGGLGMSAEAMAMGAGAVRPYELWPARIRQVGMAYLVTRNPQLVAVVQDVDAAENEALQTLMRVQFVGSFDGFAETVFAPGQEEATSATLINLAALGRVLARASGCPLAELLMREPGE